jgi:hypothetical protein
MSGKAQPGEHRGRTGDRQAEVARQVVAALLERGEPFAIAKPGRILSTWMGYGHETSFLRVILPTARHHSFSR